MEERNDLTLAEKLKACADSVTEKIRAKHGEDARLPGYIRLMFSAADYIEKQQAEIDDLKDLCEEAHRALSESAACDTCKNGPAKKCNVRGECGEDHCLWEFGRH